MARLRLTHGSITKKNGAWYWRHYRDGKQVWTRVCDVCDEFRSKKDVLPVVAKLAPTHEGPASGNLAITDYVEGVFIPRLRAEAAKPNGKQGPATVAGYEKLWRSRLRDHFGKMTLAEYRPHHATKFFDKIAPEMTANSVNHIRALMSLVFKHAAGDGRVEFNPIRDSSVRVAAKPQKETQHYTVEEMRGILAGFQSHKQARAVMALAFLGIRPAEILGLRWEDIQADGINIQRGMWKGILTPGKTGSRFVPIGPIIWGILEEYRMATKDTNVTGYVFENTVGRALNTDGLNALTARVIRPTLKALGYEWKTLYAGRRGGVTEMRRHADPQTVAFIMGHSPEVENSNYLKAVERDKRNVALIFDAALSENERQIRDSSEVPDIN